MKTLHNYLTGQVLAVLALTVTVFTFVVLLLNVLKDVLPLLFGGYASLGLAAKAIGLLLPFAVVYALPMGFITATLLVFGRFSADQELTAARAGGVSLLALITPVLLLSLLCCSVSAWFNMDLGPRSRVAFVNLRNEMLNEMANAQIPERKFIRDIPGFILYVDKNEDGRLEGIKIWQENQSNTNADFMIQAGSGRINRDRSQNQLVLNLTNCVQMMGKHGDIPFFSRQFSLSYRLEATSRTFKPKISDMTFAQLRQEERDLQALNLPVRSPAPSQAGGTNAPAAELAAQLAEADQLRPQVLERVRVEMHRQIAFSFACFGFTLVGIPLGIRVHRRETNIGIGIALGLVVVYYAFIMLGQSLSARPDLHPHLILWVPNFIFQAVGAVLLWRANRGI